MKKNQEIMLVLFLCILQDEKRRIEREGGMVLHWGTWRVNGQLAVSRAIGKTFESLKSQINLNCC